VKETAFLMSVQRIVGRVEVEHDLLRRAAARFQVVREELARDISPSDVGAFCGI
jgi:hypothetical protein